MLDLNYQFVELIITDAADFLLSKVLRNYKQKNKYGQNSKSGKTSSEIKQWNNVLLEHIHRIL